MKEAKRMKNHALALTMATAAVLATTACTPNGQDKNGQQSAQTPKAEQAAGDKTIAAGLTANGKFMAAAKTAGLDQTLAGPGPYTVFVPDDSAFDKAPAGAVGTKPEDRGKGTGIPTHLIPPGHRMAARNDKAN